MNPVLQVEQLAYAAEREPILQDIDLTLAPGDFVALIGPNGAGKTSLLRCIGGLIRPSAGRVRIAGADMKTDPMGARRALGWCVDPNALPALLTVRECLALFAGARGLGGIADDTLALCDALALGGVLDRRVDRCSLGMRQKLAIALGLTGRPALIVMDEPLNGLDPVSAHALKTHLRELCQERGVAVLMATHSLDVAERFITRAVLLVEGRQRHEWCSTQLTRMREDPHASLEQAMIDALA